MKKENIFFSDVSEIGATHEPIEHFATGKRITPQPSATSVVEGTIAFSDDGDLCYTKKDKNGVGRWFSAGLNVNFNQLKSFKLKQTWSGNKGDYNGQVHIEFSTRNALDPVGIDFSISRMFSEELDFNYVFDATFIELNARQGTTIIDDLGSTNQLEVFSWFDEVEKYLKAKNFKAWKNLITLKDVEQDLYDLQRLVATIYVNLSSKFPSSNASTISSGSQNESSSQATSISNQKYAGLTASKYFEGIVEMYKLKAIPTPDQLSKALASQRRSKNQKLIISQALGEFYLVYKYSPNLNWEEFLEAWAETTGLSVSSFDLKYFRYNIRPELASIIGYAQVNEMAGKISDDEWNSNVVFPQVFEEAIKDPKTQSRWLEAYTEFYKNNVKNGFLIENPTPVSSVTQPLEKEMSAEEVIKTMGLNGTHFYETKIEFETPEQSKRFQELIFALGGSWRKGGQNVLHTDAKYIFIDSNLQMGYEDNDEIGFNASIFRLIKYDAIFSPKQSQSQVNVQSSEEFTQTELILSRNYDISDFIGTKIIVDTPEKSIKFQELIFLLGGSWRNGEKEYQHINDPYLFVNENGFLGYVQKHKRDYFDQNTNRLIDYNELFVKPNIQPVTKSSANYVVHNSVVPNKTYQELEAEYSDLMFLISVTPTIDFTEMTSLKQQARELKDQLDASALIIKDEMLQENNIFDELFKASAIQPKHRYDLTPDPNGFAPDGTPTQLPKSIYEFTKSEDFERWFGDFQMAYQFRNSPFSEVPCSIVKNVHYEPQIVFHGTGDEFSFFDFSRFPIMYFAENYSYAEWFAQQKGQRNGHDGYIYPFFLNIKNPLDLTHFGIDEITPQEFVDWLYLQTGLEADELKINPALLSSNQPTWAWVYLRNGEEMLKVLRDTKLFDGIVYYEQNPPINPTAPNYKTKGFIIFEPQSAKIVDPQRHNLLLPSMRSFYLKKGGKL